MTILPLYTKSYKKAEPKIKKAPKKESFDIDDSIDRIIYSNVFRKIVPAFLFLTGVGLLTYQIYPNIKYKLDSAYNKYDQEILSVVPEDYYIKKAELISSVQKGYFSSVIESAEVSNKVLGKSEDTISETYVGTFKLSIPSVNLVSLPIQANVDSASENVYNPILQHNLAHFKGTPVPGMPGNTFVYGHSIQESAYFDDPKNPYVAFTKLFRVKIGEKIFIERDGVNYSYTIFKVKEVSPTDVSVLENTVDNVLTLMTCSPPGNNTKRLIVVARQDNI